VAPVSEPTTEFVVGPRERGKRLDHFLHERIPGLSRTRIQNTIVERVELSWGGVARPSTGVQPGGIVRIRYTPPVETRLELTIPVLARGEGWLAVDKPPGIPVHPVNKVFENSLIRMLRRQEDDETLTLAHRLDSETSGVLLIATNRTLARHLGRAFARRDVHKEYLAVVRGCVAEDDGVITHSIGEATDSEVYNKLEAGHGKSAETGFRVERRMSDRTLLRLFPKTGRRHQLRVHLQSIGHPILGDILYDHGDAAYLAMVHGEGDVRKQGSGPFRQLLHCAEMTFGEPGVADPTTVRAPLPEDFPK